MIKKFINTTLIFFLVISTAYSEIYTSKLKNIIYRNDTGKNLFLPTTVFCNRKNDEFYVIDSPKARIILYNFNFFPYYSIGKGRGIVKPVAISVNNNGSIYVLQSKSNSTEYSKITIFTSSWIKKKDIILNDFKNADRFTVKSLAVSEKGKIYIIGNIVKGVVVLNKNGNFLRIIHVKDTVQKGEKPMEVNFSDVYIDKNKRFYFLSEETSKVYVFSSKEKLIFKAGIKGGTPGKLSRPRGIAVDYKKKLIYIVDYMRHIVQCLDYNTGKYMFEIGGYGASPGYFNYPTDIDIDSMGNIYVTDMFNKRVQIFEIKSENQ